MWGKTSYISGCLKQNKEAVACDHAFLIGNMPMRAYGSRRVPPSFKMSVKMAEWHPVYQVTPVLKMSRCWCNSLCVPLPFRIRVIFFISELSLVAVFTKKLFAILHAYSLMYFTSVTSCSVRIRVRRLAPNIIRKHLFCATCSFRIKYFAHMDHTGAPYTKIGLSTILKSTKSFTSFEVL